MGGHAAGVAGHALDHQSAGSIVRDSGEQCSTAPSRILRADNGSEAEIGDPVRTVERGLPMRCGGKI